MTRKGSQVKVLYGPPTIRPTEAQFDLRGRAEIEQQHTVIHGGVYKASTARFVVAGSREVVQGLIVAHLSSEVQGREGAEAKLSARS